MFVSIFLKIHVLISSAINNNDEFLNNFAILCDKDYGVLL